MILPGVGRWKWGGRKSFFRFPTNETINPVGNSAANTQKFIDLLDDIHPHDALKIANYLRGRTGFPAFLKMAADCLTDPQIVSVLWADLPDEAINLRPKDVPTEDDCRSVRTQMLKML